MGMGYGMMGGYNQMRNPYQNPYQQQPGFGYNPNNYSPYAQHRFQGYGGMQAQQQQPQQANPFMSASSIPTNAMMR